MGMGIPCLAKDVKARYVMVTGGKGFVGSYAAKALENRGFGVITYDRLDEEDILDRTQLEYHVRTTAPCWIIHLAGQVYLNPSLENPQNDANLNIIGSLNVLEAARKYKCGVTFSSSGAVYGNNYQYPEPVSPYGVSKFAVENYFKLYHQLYNMNTVVFRFSSVYGKGRAPTSINLIIKKALEGETIKLTGDGTQTRDFTYVTDVAEALAMSAKGMFPSGVYDIGTGTATSLNELIRMLENILDKKINVEYVPENMGDPKRNELNVSKAACYGFYAKTTLEEGLRILVSQITQTKN